MFVTTGLRLAITIWASWKTFALLETPNVSETSQDLRPEVPQDVPAVPSRVVGVPRKRWLAFWVVLAVAKVVEDIADIFFFW
ncbi:hypothetical protein HK102_001539 [Quaeritorhiza haematococci]|nr:hypothetical protein HK102_001539 [Quaeritorhiza haematococci]